jgi:DNA-binding NtrC family response regulator
VRTGVLFGLPSPALALLEAGRLHEGLARQLAERQLQLPKLSERAEDLRALVLEGLSRFGIASSGEPLGIEPAALGALTEHEFPGNELELFGLLARTAASARGARLTLADLLGNGLGSPSQAPAPSEPAEDPSLSPPPSLAVRRRSLRRAPGR